MTRPLIGVTVSHRSGWRIYPVLRTSLRLAGARTVRWDSRRDADIDAVDGLLVGGGDDIGAEHYGGEIMVKSRIDPARDALERLEPESRLAELTGRQPMRVNALHSQAVNRLGEGLLVAARDQHGMVQAIERAADPFVLGVQWHPEYLFYARRQRRIFRALSVAALACRKDAPQTAAVDELPA